MSDPFDGMISSGLSGALMTGANMVSPMQNQSMQAADRQLARDNQMWQFMMQQDALARSDRESGRQFDMQVMRSDRDMLARREESAFARLNSALDRQLQVAELESKERQQAFENTLRVQSVGLDLRIKSAQVRQFEAAQAAQEIPGKFEMLLAEREVTGDTQRFHNGLGALIAENPLAYGELKRQDPALYGRISEIRQATALATRDVLDFDALGLGEIKFTKNADFDGYVNELDLAGTSQTGNTSATVVRLAELAGVDLKRDPDPASGIKRYLQSVYPGASRALRQLDDPKIRADFNARASHGVYVMPTKEQSLQYADIIRSNREREVSVLAEMEAAGVPSELIVELRNSYAQERKDAWFAAIGVDNPELAREANPDAGLFDSTLAEMKAVASKERLLRDTPGVAGVAGAARAAWAGITGRKANPLDVDRAKGLAAGTTILASELGKTIGGLPVRAAEATGLIEDGELGRWRESVDAGQRQLGRWARSNDPRSAAARESVGFDTLERATMDYQEVLRTAQYLPNLGPQDRMAMVSEASENAVQAAMSYGVPEALARQRYAPQRFLNPSRVRDDLLLPVRALVTGTTPLALMQSAAKDPTVWAQSNRYYIEQWAREQKASRYHLQTQAVLGRPDGGGVQDLFNPGTTTE